jgi:hypothetical protein
MLRDSKLRSCLFMFIVGGTAAACVDADGLSTGRQASTGSGAPYGDESPDAAVIDAPAADPGVQTLQTFDDWLAAHPGALSPEQVAELAEVGFVADVVPVEDLPIRYPNGVIEVDPDTLAALTEGGVGIEENFAQWVELGLYDPTMEAQHELYQQISAPIANTELKADTTTPPPAGPNCLVEVALIATRVDWTPNPAKSEQNLDVCGEEFISDTTRTWQSANVASRAASGGFRSDPGAGANDTCSATSDMQGGRTVLTVTTKVVNWYAADPSRPRDCDGITGYDATVAGRSALRNSGVATVGFQPIGENYRIREQYKALAATEVQASTFGNSLNAGGEIEVGSECEGSMEIGATLNVSKSAGGDVGFKSGRVCKLQTPATAKLNLNVEASNSQSKKVVVGTPMQLQIETISARSQGTSSYPAAGVGTFPYKYQAVSSAGVSSAYGCMSAQVTSCEVAATRAGFQCRPHTTHYGYWYSANGGYNACNGRLTW